MKNTTTIRNVAIIPMPGNRLMNHADVVIEYGRIKEISASKHPSNGIYKEKRIVDGTGKYLIPGLFDMHVHLHDKYFLSLFLMNGITSIREMGSTKEGIFLLKERVNEGKILGPRMFVCGPILEGNPPFWPDFYVVRTKIDARKTIQELKNQGADFIKVYFTLKPEIYKAILHVAKEQGLQVVGHLPKKIDPIQALELGHIELEHMSDITQYVGEVKAIQASEKEYIGWRRFMGFKTDKERLMQLGKSLQKNNAFICPTLVVNEKMSQLSNYEKLARSKEAQQLPTYYRKIRWNPNHPKSFENIRGVRPLWFKNLKVLHENSKKLIPFLARHGVLLAGSDTPNPFVVPGFSLLEELELFVKAGLKPFQALESATYSPSTFLNVLDELGTIEEGKIANLVLLRKNPLRDISALRSMQGIFLNGNYHSHAMLKNKVFRR